MDIEEVKRKQQEHLESNFPLDAYQASFYNGMEMAISILENKQPKFKDIGRKQKLETMIRYHMEAMKPLLTEWSKST